MNVPHALPQSEWGPAAPLTALHQGWWLLQQVGILHLSRHEEDRSYLICRSTSLIYCASACVCVWCVCLRGWIKQTSSKNCCVRRRMCLSSVSSRKFFFSASWLVLISFSSFSSFSKVACQSRDTHCYAFIYSRLLLHLLLQCFGI